MAGFALERLETLYIPSTNFTDSDMLATGAFPKLKALTVSSCGRLTTKGLHKAMVTGAYPALEELHLDHTPVNQWVVDAAVYNITHLSFLSVSYTPYATEQEEKTIRTHEGGRTIMISC